MFAWIKVVIAGAAIAGAAHTSSLTYTVRNSGLAYRTAAGLSTSFPGPLQTGDQIFARDNLFQGSKKIGWDNETCTVTFDGNDLCRVVAVFPGNGDVETTWLWVGRNTSALGPRHFGGAIVGGTGIYAGARGDFAATALADGTLRITASFR